MHKYILSTLLCVGAAFAAETPIIGAVNLSSCIADSKSGKKEQESYEALRSHMASLVESTEKELKELSAKFEDSDYLDSLSPKAEEELKLRFQSLQEDMGRYQNQFYQVMQHANYQMMQKIQSSIASAAEKIAKEHHLDYVLNKDACFYISPDLDVTASVISEMDRNFEAEQQTKKLTEADEIKAVDELTLDQAG